LLAKLQQTGQDVWMDHFSVETCFRDRAMQKSDLLFLTLICCFSASALGAPPETHTDESRVPDYQLPDPLKFSDGSPVTTAEAWNKQRRPQIFQLFQEFVYGKAPAAPKDLKFHVISEDGHALGDKAIRKEIEITLAEKPRPVVMTMLLYIPKQSRPAPVFWGLNFRGNQTVTDDPGVRLNPNWMTSRSAGVVDNHATEESRGTRTNRWPIPMIIERGYAVATAYYGDIDPDFDDDFQNGIQPAFYKSGQTRPAADEWGSIGAWAWGLSRGLDYLEKDPDIDAAHVAVLGHSRLGKTALWAAASDPRFALVISNDSGCGGAALSRRHFGETVARINYSFPHWFCDNFNQFNENEAALPIDQHELMALIAPRPVYVASASEDLWADPRGEFLSAVHADPVYRLLGTGGFGGKAPPAQMPANDSPLNSGTIAYHIRTGKHDVTAYDWTQYLNFADRHFRAR
jgi:hypothetical protein